VNRTYRNSHRSDLGPRHGYVPYGGHARAISPRETDSKWGDRWPFDLDSDAGGHSVTPPVGWIEDYWMGRYYGFIQPALSNLVSEPAMLLHKAERRVAEPYAGPPRPVSN